MADNDNLTSKNGVILTKEGSHVMQDTHFVRSLLRQDDTVDGFMRYITVSIQIHRAE